MRQAFMAGNELVFFAQHLINPGLVILSALTLSSQLLRSIFIVLENNGLQYVSRYAYVLHTVNVLDRFWSSWFLLCEVLHSCEALGLYEDVNLCA